MTGIAARHNAVMLVQCPLIGLLAAVEAASAAQLPRGIIFPKRIASVVLLLMENPDL
jgi:hypothetical protein